jgi:hypothetical protein
MFLMLLVADDDHYNILPNLISLRITFSYLHQVLKPPAAVHVVFIFRAIRVRYV